ncbi:MAG: GAF domain-containing protein [Leptolyngbya sp. SIOISBB]|nr:GAF domain-containing protein [Leptolyngbya sp. SIOISBB]
MLDSLPSKAIDYSPVVVPRQTSLQKAIAALRQADFTAIWVVETDHAGNQQLLGAVFSAQLLQACITDSNPLDSYLESIMVRDLPLLSLAAPPSVESCLNYFIQYRVDFLPITYPDAAFAGVVSKWKLLQHYCQVGNISLLEPVFAGSPDGFWMTACDEPIDWHNTLDKAAVLEDMFAHQHITQVNDAFLNQHGISRTDLMGQTLADFTVPDLAHEKLKWQQFFDTGTMCATTEERRLDDEVSIWLEAHYTCLYDSQGRIVGHFCIQRDITHYKEIEARLMQQERYLYVIVAIQQRLLGAGHHVLYNHVDPQHEDPDQTDQLSFQSTLKALRPVYQEILGQLGETASASRVYLFENDADCMSQQLEWCDEGITPEIDNPLLQNLSYEDFFPRWLKVLVNGEPINGVVSDFPESEQAVLAGQGILSILILPLIIEGQFWGFIGFDNCRTAIPWDNSEVTLLAAAAAALSMHLESCQVDYSRQRSWHRERLTYQLINQMRQTLQIDDIFDTTTRQLRRLLKCDRTVIYRFNSDWSGSFVAESVSSDWIPLNQLYCDPPHLEDITVSSDTCQVQNWQAPIPFGADTYLQESQGGAYHQGKLYSQIADVYQADFESCYLDFLSRMQVRAYLTIPIFSGNRLWGLLANYQNSGPRQWETDDVNLVLHITTQLGIALQQVELLEQTRQQSLELAKANAAAAAAIQAKADFLANVSHELRTPLNSILGFSKILSDELMPSSELPTEVTAQEHKEYADIIGRNGRDLLTLINNVLEVTRLDAGRSQVLSERFDLSQLLQDLQLVLNKQAVAKDLALVFHLSPELPQQIVSDRDKLWHVLVNLCSNAIKFTASGRVTLRVDVRNQIEIDAKTIRLNLAFEVEDTGQGIAPAELDNLFQPFYMTQSGRQIDQGSGLGLAVSQKFVNLLGGHITVNSAVKHGSLFKFNIWVVLGGKHTAAALSPTPILGTPASTPTLPYRIVIVDSQFQDHYQLKQVLSPLGVDLRTASSNPEALTLWSEWQPHLLFIDLPKASTDSQSILQHIHQETQKQDSNSLGDPLLPTKVIALVPQGQHPASLDLVSRDFDDVLYWPSQDADLLQILSKHLPLSHLVSDSPAASNPPDLPPALTQLSQARQRAAIGQMPLSWRQQLYQAALTGSDEKLWSLIAQLPAEQFPLIQLLNTLTGNFQFDQITALISDD